MTDEHMTLKDERTLLEITTGGGLFIWQGIRTAIRRAMSELKFANSIKNAQSHEIDALREEITRAKRQLVLLSERNSTLETMLSDAEKHAVESRETADGLTAENERLRMAHRSVGGLEKAVVRLEEENAKLHLESKAGFVERAQAVDAKRNLAATLTNKLNQLYEIVNGTDGARK